MHVEITRAGKRLRDAITAADPDGPPFTNEDLAALEDSLGVNVAEPWRTILVTFGFGPRRGYTKYNDFIELGETLDLRPKEAADHQRRSRDGRRVAANGDHVLGLVGDGDCLVFRPGEKNAVVRFRDHSSGDERELYRLSDLLDACAANIELELRIAGGPLFVEREVAPEHPISQAMYEVLWKKRDPADVLAWVEQYDGDLEFAPAGRDLPLHMALHYATWNAEKILPIAEKLVAAGADPKTLGPKGDSAFHKLCARSLDKDAATFPLFEAWLSRDPSLANHRDARGRTPLMLLGYRVRPVVMELLLEHGADPTLEDAAGRSCLQYFAHDEGESLVWAMERGVPAKGWDFSPKQESALASVISDAAKNNNIALLEWALAFGSDINAKRTGGARPFRDALGSETLVDLFLSKGATPCYLFRAADKGDLALMEKLIAHGAEVDEYDSYGWKNALIIAARRGWVEGVQLLLRSGADPTLQSNFDREEPKTPLEHALENEHEDCAKLLRDAVTNWRSSKT